MKKFLVVLFLTLLTSNVYAGGQQTLVTPDGRVLGTASNPLVVTGAGGSIGAQGEDSSVIFNVKTEYGAAGDGIFLADGVVASGSTAFTSATATFTPSDVGKIITIVSAGAVSSTTTRSDGAITAATTAFTSAGASFSTADVNKLISIAGAGAAGSTFYTRISAYVSATAVTLQDAAVTTVSGASFTYGNGEDLTTTISAYVSPTAVTLTDAASNSVNGEPTTYGTDDTEEIQDAIDAVLASNPPTGTVFFPQGIYIVNGAYTANNNSQIGLPNIADSDPTTTIRSVKLKGVMVQKTNNPYRYQNGGTILYSTRNGTDGTYSIISGISSGSIGNITDIQLEIENIAFRTVQNPKNSGLNLVDVKATIGTGIAIDTAGILRARLAKPTHSDSYGIKSAGELNNGVNYWEKIFISGFYNAFLAGEHTSLNNAQIKHYVYGLVFPTMTHDTWMGYVQAENGINTAYCIGTAQITIQMLDIEHSGTTGWWTNVYDLVDASSTCSGTINYDIVGTGGASPSFSRSGGRFVASSALAGDKNIYSNGQTALTMRNGANSSSSGGATLFLEHHDGSAMASGDRLGSIYFQGARGTTETMNLAASIHGFASQTFTSSNGGGELTFMTAPNNSTTRVERMRISQAGYVGIGNTAPNGMLVVDPPAAQTIAAGNTIADDSCGTLKLITSAGAVTTDTTNTFTAPAAGNEGCIMHVCNTGANNITLDNNANFKSAGGADVVMTADDCVTVGSTGASGVWYQLTALEAN